MYFNIYRLEILYIFIKNIVLSLVIRWLWYCFYLKHKKKNTGKNLKFSNWEIFY